MLDAVAEHTVVAIAALQIFKPWISAWADFVIMKFGLNLASG